jgi:hypothetical protein
MNIVTMAGANQDGLPNLAEFGLAVGGGVKTGLFLRDFEIGILKPYQNNADAGEQFVRLRGLNLLVLVRANPSVADSAEI